MSVVLHHGSCIYVLPKLGGFDMVFADPPDNIGLKYNGFEDKMSYNDYMNFLYDVVLKMRDAAPISWMSFNAKWMSGVGVIADALDDNHRFFVQTFTFGNNQRKDFVNGFRPILRIMREDAITYPEDVYVKSWRQQNGDPRASNKGKMPDDVWDFPRVVGNSKQRRSWSPTQLHEGLYKRAIDFSCQPGGRICDMFAGSGTMARVAGETHDVHLIELSDMTKENIRKEHNCECKCYIQSCGC